MVCDDEIMGDDCDGVYGAGSIVIEENSIIKMTLLLIFDIMIVAYAIIKGSKNRTKTN